MGGGGWGDGGVTAEANVWEEGGGRKGGGRKVLSGCVTKGSSFLDPKFACADARRACMRLLTKESRINPGTTYLRLSLRDSLSVCVRICVQQSSS